MTGAENLAKYLVVDICESIGLNKICCFFIKKKKIKKIDFTTPTNAQIGPKINLFGYIWFFYKFIKNLVKKFVNESFK